MAWNTKFKQASAAKRRLKEAEQPPSLRRLEQHVINDARRVSPEHFLRRHYPLVKTTQSGQSVSVPKVLRCDFNCDHWVSCSWEGEPIGDNVALVQFVTSGVLFPDAIRELTGAEVFSRIQPTSPFASVLPSCPSLPPVGGEDRGRSYLRQRGISEEAIQLAESSGFLCYATSGVIFLGRDLSVPSRTIRSATLRYFEPVEWDGDLLTKRDFANTDKGFPAVLPGDPRFVVVVESGISGLAARDIVVRQDQLSPTVIVSGGVNTRRWALVNEPVRRILCDANRIEIWGERESGPEKQARTDALRQKLATVIAEQVQGELPVIVYPPEGVKDAADWNLRISASFDGYPSAAPDLGRVR